MIPATLVTRSAAILSFAVTVLLLGCGGWSSSTTDTPTGPGTTAQSTHSVNLSWNASTSSDVSGYNIYRATYTDSCGSFSRINDTLNTSTLYTDSEVIEGTSYCYAATTVNTMNEESGYSNIAINVQIPVP
ncbi:MAG: fibronectin type III domain-containing protein [Candidatus Sulfotelmatobacter sp.]